MDNRVLSAFSEETLVDLNQFTDSGVSDMVRDRGNMSST